MVTRPYDYESDVLKPHSRQKHAVLGTYLYDYFMVRTANPVIPKIRVAVVDGFSGAGRYACGSPGSPIVILDALEKAVFAMAIRRSEQVDKPLAIEVELYLNDNNRDVIHLLRANIENVVSRVRACSQQLTLNVHILNDDYVVAHQKISADIKQKKISNVLFNLDQCGYVRAPMKLIPQIMMEFSGAEVFYNFSIEGLLTRLPWEPEEQVQERMKTLVLDVEPDVDLDLIKDKRVWLGAVERWIFQNFHSVAPYVSPFSINNPTGYSKYWLMHFANSVRARQVYNNVLYQHANFQAHYGRGGLNMLSYNPALDEGDMFVFGEDDRERSVEDLLETIPELISLNSDQMSVENFYQQAYKQTPAHSDDINLALHHHPEIEVLTPQNVERQRAHTFKPTDTIKLRRQKIFPGLVHSLRKDKK